MIQTIPFIFDKTNPKEKKGVIQIGAHYGQEIPFLLEIGINNIIAFEPLDHPFNELSKNFQNKIKCIKKAVGNQNGTIEMYTESANHGQSSSVLKPKKHLEIYPNIKFENTITCEIVRLDDEIKNANQYNILLVDVQGYELEVFKGAVNTLANIDLIITEVNNDELYEDCAKIADLDKFLENLSFKRILTSWQEDVWGNAVYIKI
jgi:FkbM family methyltransferase